MYVRCSRQLGEVHDDPGQSENHAVTQTGVNEMRRGFRVKKVGGFVLDKKENWLFLLDLACLLTESMRTSNNKTAENLGHPSSFYTSPSLWGCPLGSSDSSTLHTSCK